LQPNVPEFIDLLRAFNDQEVRYVIVGGLAMVLHGSTFPTFDLDLAISDDQANAEPIVRALAPLHPFPPQYGSPKNFVWDARSITGAVISLATDAGFVDLLRVHPGVDGFEKLWERAEARLVAGLLIRVACLDDLIKMKRAANRPKDLEHIKQLESLKSIRDSAPPTGL